MVCCLPRVAKLRFLDGSVWENGAIRAFDPCAGTHASGCTVASSFRSAFICVRVPASAGVLRLVLFMEPDLECDIGRPHAVGECPYRDVVGPHLRIISNVLKGNPSGRLDLDLR
jgi:hypothetical protein